MLELEQLSWIMRQMPHIKGDGATGRKEVIWVLIFMEMSHQSWTTYLQVLLSWKKNELLYCLTHYFFGFFSLLLLNIILNNIYVRGEPQEPLAFNCSATEINPQIKFKKENLRGIDTSYWVTTDTLQLPSRYHPSLTGHVPESSFPAALVECLGMSFVGDNVPPSERAWFPEPGPPSRRV